MATEDALLSIDAVEELRSIYDEAHAFFNGKAAKGRRLSLFAKAPYVPPQWAQAYFCRFDHIASSELANKAKPRGLGAILMILTETRALIMDVYDAKKDTGDSSAKIFENLGWVLNVIQKLEVVIDRVMGKDKLNDVYSRVSVMQVSRQSVEAHVEGKDESLPLFVLAPLLMLEQRVFAQTGEPGGGEHAEIFKLHPEIQNFKKQIHSSQAQGFDDVSCLLLTANTIGAVTLKIMENTKLRHRYYDALNSVFNFTRMAAWGELKHSYGADLATSTEWKGTSAFDDKVITKRRNSVNSVAAAPSSTPPPPKPMTAAVPPPPSRDGPTEAPPSYFPDKVYDGR